MTRSTRSDNKFAGLGTLGGTALHIDDRENQVLVGAVGSQKTPNDMWYQIFTGNVNVTDRSWNGAAYQWLGEMGHTTPQTLAERWEAYWYGLAGGPATEIGVILNDSSPYGKGRYATQMPVLNANDVGSIAIKCTFNGVAGASRIMMQKVLTGVNGLIEIAADFQTAWVRNDAGVASPAVNIAALGFGLGTKKTVEVICTRNAAGTLTKYEMTNENGTPIIELDSGLGMQPRWGSVGPYPASPTERSGFSVWTVDVDFPGRTEFYPVDENTGSQSTPSGGGTALNWFDFSWGSG